MFCRICGYNLKDTAQFCNNCGTRVIIMSAREPASAVNVAPAASVPASAVNAAPTAAPAAAVFRPGSAAAVISPAVTTVKATDTAPSRSFQKPKKKKTGLIVALILGMLMTLGILVIGFIIIPPLLDGQTNKSSLPISEENVQSSLPSMEGPLGKGDGTVTLELGEEIKASVDSKEETDATLFSVKDSESPVDGLLLKIPNDSYSDMPEISISTTEIKGSDFGKGFEWVTPLVHVNNGGEYAENFMTLTIPCTIGEDETALAFYIDPETGVIEPITIAEQSAEGVTLIVFHFSDIAIAKVLSVPDKAFETQVTGFTPGVDDFSFRNEGSYIAPGGHCQGQSLSAIWYYLHLKSTQGSLFTQFDNVQKQELGFTTPDFQDDDSLAYRLCSVAQVTEHKSNGNFLDILQRSDRDTYVNMITALSSGQPQLINIYGKVDGKYVGHSIIAYRSEPGKIYVSDPNYPGKTDRYIELVDGEFKPYNSGENALSIASGQEIAYTNFNVAGFSTYFSPSEMSALWAELDAKTIGDTQFTKSVTPSIYALGIDENGLETSIEIKDGYKVTNGKLEGVKISSYYQGGGFKLAIYDGKTFTLLTSSVETYNSMDALDITLSPGVNYIGVSQYLTDDDGFAWWNNFKWTKVESVVPWEGTYKGTIVLDKLERPTLADLLALIPNTGDAQYDMNVQALTVQYNNTQDYVNQSFDVTAAIKAGESPGTYVIDWHYVMGSNTEYLIYDWHIDENQLLKEVGAPLSLHSSIIEDSFTREITFTIDDSIKDGKIRLVGKDSLSGIGIFPIGESCNETAYYTIKLEQLPPQ